MRRQPSNQYAATRLWSPHNSAYLTISLDTGAGPVRASHVIGRNITQATFWESTFFSHKKYDGPKLSGYSRTEATRNSVTTKAAPGFLRSDVTRYLGVSLRRFY
jgi:hypothetical protein